MKTFALSGDELLARGVTNSLKVLRPVLGVNEGPPEMMVGNATLREDEWRMIDDRVNAVLRERITVADDLRSRGLITPVGLGTVLRVTERLTGAEEAQLSFDGDTPPRKILQDFQKDTVPVPILSQGFSIGWRQLEASRTRGEPLDTTLAEQAARSVQRRLQNLITLGYNVGGTMAIPGLTTAANRIPVTLTADWDASGGDPVADVVRMLAAAFAQNLFGPFFLYIPKNYWALLQEDYSTVKGDRTLLERLSAFNEIEQVRPLDALPNDNVVLVQMTSDVLDLSEAQAVTTVQWEKNPFVTEFRVLTVGGPQIKSIATEAGATVNGIVHLAA